MDNLRRLLPFIFRAFALYWDRPATDRPPLPAEARYAITSITDFARRHSAPPSIVMDATAAAVGALQGSCLSSGAAAAIGEVIRNNVVTADQATAATASGFLLPVLEAAEQWPNDAAAQTQLLSAAYNMTCSDAARALLGRSAKVLVRAGRAAFGALRKHADNGDAVTAALRLLGQPCSNAMGVEAAGTRWLVEEGGHEAVADAIERYTARAEWGVVSRAVTLLGSWAVNPFNASKYDGAVHTALCAACVACREPSVPDGLRIALSGALNAYSRHTPNGVQVQQALLLMEDD